MAFSIDSGVGGSVKIGSTSVGEVLTWTFRKTANTPQFGTSESAGYARAISGNKRGSGTITGKLDSLAVSPIVEGTAATLKLYTNATEFYTVPAKISDFEVTVDMDNGDPNGFSASFVTDGAWTEPTLS